MLDSTNRSIIFFASFISYASNPLKACIISLDDRFLMFPLNRLLVIFRASSYASSPCKNVTISLANVLCANLFSGSFSVLSANLSISSFDRKVYFFK